MSTQLNLTSRRALIAGAVGAAGALVGAFARPPSAQGAVGDPVRAGQTTTAAGATTTLSNNSNTNHTFVVVQNGHSTAIRGEANGGVGGRFKTGGKDKMALIATNAAAQPGEGAAVQANGGWNRGVEAESVYTAISATSLQAAAVYGHSQSAAGVLAESVDGFGLHCFSDNSYAAYIAGPMLSISYFEVQELGANPAAPADHRGRVFMRDSGTGKTQLCVRFPTGAVQVIAAEP